MAYLPTCQRTLRAFCSLAIKPCVLTCAATNMPCVLTSSRVHVLCAFLCSRANAPYILTWSRVNMASNNRNKFSITCFI